LGESNVKGPPLWTGKAQNSFSVRIQRAKIKGIGVLNTGSQPQTTRKRKHTRGRKKFRSRKDRISKNPYKIKKPFLKPP